MKTVLIFAGLFIFISGFSSIRQDIENIIINAGKKTWVSDKKSSNSRLAKVEKTEFTDVNEYFSDKRNAEVGLFLQTLIKPQDHQILQEVFDKLRKEKDVETAKLVIKAGKIFLGAPYVAHTLEKDTEQLVINLREFDCTTFVENCLGIARTIKYENPTVEKFAHELQNMRYYNGEINDYTSRIHYFSDWIDQNDKRGIVKSVSKEIDIPYPLNLNFMSSHPESYQKLKADGSLIPKIVEREQHINDKNWFFIPKEKLAEFENKLMDGDIVGITTSVKGLDISHAGILIRENKRVHLMHASSLAQKVIISEETLEEYLLKSRSATGIMVARPL